MMSNSFIFVPFFIDKPQIILHCTSGGKYFVFIVLISCEIILSSQVNYSNINLDYGVQCTFPVLRMGR